MPKPQRLGPRVPPRGLLSGGFLLLVLLGSGCAYYNTFYTAKKHYREAERQYEVSGQEHPSPTVLDLYQRSIEKSQKVLVDFPKSKWVDDARYLIAMSYLRREDWEKARTSFEDLIASHPKSKLVPDAKLGIGVSLLGMGDHVGAEEVLTQTLQEYPKFKRRDEVILELAQNAARRRDHRAAIHGYSALLDQDPDEELERRAYEARGESYLEVDAPDSALADFVALAALQSLPEKRYEAELQQGECLERLGRFDEALALYSRLEREMPGPNQLPRTLLGHARTLNEVTRHDESLVMYERVVTDFPSSSYAAEAQFQIGVTREDYLSDLEGAKEAFGKVKQVAPSSEFAALADERKQAIELYGEYRAEMAGGDESEKKAEANLKLAELTLFRMRKVDEALAAYQAVERDFPQSRTAPRAAFAIAWIQEHEIGDSLIALACYKHVYNLYPESEQGVVAGVRAGVLAPDSLPIYLGQVLRIQAAADSAQAVVRAQAAADSLLAAGGPAAMDSLGADSLGLHVAPELAADSLLAHQRAVLAGDSGSGEPGLEAMGPSPLPPRRPPGARPPVNPFLPVAPGARSGPDSAAAAPDTAVARGATAAPDSTAVPDTTTAYAPVPPIPAPPDTAAAPDSVGTGGEP